jgi:outer membrane protein assembly factor BamB
MTAMNRHVARVFVCASVLLGVVRVSTADTTEALVVRVLAAAGRPVGLAHLPRAGTGELALALAKGSPGTFVHAQEFDPVRVTKARKAADDAGLLGRRVWIDQGGLDRLLPAGHSADLIAMTDLMPADLTPALAAEIRRVLHPWFGVAVFAPNDAGVRAWAQSIGAVTESASLLVVKAGPLPGADDWPMWWHGPDNNAVSTDTAFKLPATVQWTGKPYFGPTRLELPIVAGGRLFMLWNGDAMDSSQGPIMLAGQDGDGPLLTAQAVGSGVCLWTRRLSPAAWAQVSRSILAADGEHLLVAEGNRVLELNGATGQEVRNAQLDCEEIKWMALRDGRVFVLGGARTQDFGQRSEKAVAPFRSSGLNLMALDRGTFAPVWRVERQAGKDAFDPRSPAIDGDRLFVAGEGDTAESFTVKDGKRLWHVKLGFERSRVVGFDWDRSSRHPVTGYAAAGVYVVSGLELNEAVVLSQADGKRLWTAPQPGAGQFMPLAFQGLLWKGATGLDPLTGKEQKKLDAAKSGGCARNTMAPQGLIEASGLTYDFLAGKPSAMHEPLKSSCSAGSFVADGLLWKFPVPCTACTEWRGFVVQAAAERPAPPPPRLCGGSITPATAEASGWLTYRGSPARSSATGATIPAAARIRWTASPAHPAGPLSQPGRTMMDAELVPAPPLVAGDRVIVGYADGAVDALDLNNGKRLWRVYTGGRIHSSPTVWRDRVFAGSADGHLYAFALADGRELWRLRAAPETGRVMVYGQLGSRWPILGSPLVADGKVVVSAGLMETPDGVHVVCADAVSGRVLWEQSDWTASESGGLISGGAQFALGDGLFYHGGMAPPIRLAVADGACQPVFPAGAGARWGSWKIDRWKTIKAFNAAWSRVKGQDIGVFGNDWLIYGGRRMWTDQAEAGTWRSTIKFLRRGHLPVVDVTDAEVLPAWDDRDAAFIYSTKRADGIVVISRDKLQSALDALLEGKSTAEILAMDDQPSKQGVTVPPELLSKALAVNTEGLFRWSNALEYRWEPLACVLAGNAVVVVTTHPDRDPQKALPGRVTALRRTDGAKMWEVDLPARAVHNGLAVAADGRVVVTLLDGTVIGVGP